MASSSCSLLPFAPFSTNKKRSFNTGLPSIHSLAKTQNIYWYCQNSFIQTNIQGIQCFRGCFCALFYIGKANTSRIAQYGTKLTTLLISHISQLNFFKLIYIYIYINSSVFFLIYRGSLTTERIVQ